MNTIVKSSTPHRVILSSPNSLVKDATCVSIKSDRVGKIYLPFGDNPGVTSVTQASGTGDFEIIGHLLDKWFPEGDELELLPEAA